MTSSIQNFEFLSRSTVETVLLTTTAMVFHPSNVDHRRSFCLRPTIIPFDSSFTAFVCSTKSYEKASESASQNNARPWMAGRRSTHRWTIERPHCPYVTFSHVKNVQLVLLRRLNHQNIVNTISLTLRSSLEHFERDYRPPRCSRELKLLTSTISCRSWMHCFTQLSTMMLKSRRNRLVLSANINLG